MNPTVKPQAQLRFNLQTNEEYVGYKNKQPVTKFSVDRFVTANDFSTLLLGMFCLLCVIFHSMNHKVNYFYCTLGGG